MAIKMRTKDLKDSGVEWIGKIPHDWNVKKLKHCLTRNDGGVWGEDDPTSAGTPVLRSTEIAEGGKWQIEDPATRQLSAHEIAGALLRAGDLVLTKSSGSEFHLGKTALVTKEMEKVGYAYSNFMQRLRMRTEIDPSFLFYALNSIVGRSQINYWGLTTSGLVNLNANIVNQFMFAFPDVEEQKSLSSYLDVGTSTIDRAIEQKYKLIDLLKEKRTAIINRAVTRGLDENVELVDSGVEWIGKVPKGWNMRKIAQSFNLIGSGSTPDSGNEGYYEDGDIDWVITGDLNDGVLKEASKKITKEAFLSSSALKMYPRGTLLIAMYGATIGRIALLDIPACTNQACCAISQSSYFDNKFVYYWFLVNRKNIVDIYSYGSGQPNISQNTIKNLRLPAPPIEEQRKIVAFLDKKTSIVDEAISKVEESIYLLDEYRRSLISHIVTGKAEI